MRYSIDGGGRFSVRHTHALIGLNEGPGLLSLPDEITPVIDIGDDERQRNMLRNGQQGFKRELDGLIRGSVLIIARTGARSFPGEGNFRL